VEQGGHRNWKISVTGAIIACILLIGASAAHAQNPNVTGQQPFQDEIRDDLKPMIVPPKPEPLEWTGDKDSQDNYLWT
jgi:hypothetical protein